MKNYLPLLFLFISISVLAQAPVLVKDIYPGSTSSINGGLAQATATLNGKLIFAANGEEGDELWVSDGSAAGTILLKDINIGPSASSYCRNMYVVNNYVLFTANDGVHGLELWRTDGTPEGTQMVKDIRPGAPDGVFVTLSNPLPDFYVWNNVIFFNGNDGTGEELWRSDGTESGTYMVKDINPTPGFTSTSNPRHYAEYNNKLYFSASSPFEGIELWVTDGTAAGTMLVKSIQPDFYSSEPTNLISCNGYLLFIAKDQQYTNDELWRSDGTANGTVKVKEINPNGNGLVNNSNIYERLLIKIENVVYFTANDGVHGYELWRSDGTEAGTFMVKDASANLPGFAPRNFAVANNILYYRYDDAVYGQELWRSDGTEAGTYMVKDIEPGFFGSFSPYASIFSYNNVIYFNAVNSNSFWKTDGTEAGTVSVAGNTPAFLFNNPQFYHGTNNFIYFTASTPANGTELWKYYTLPLSPLVASIEPQNPISCAGQSDGALFVNVSGGLAPFIFEWSPALVQGQNPVGLSSGSYVVTVNDAAGAVTSASYELSEPSALIGNFSSTPASPGNSDGSAQVSVSGGTPEYSYLWNTTPPASTSGINNVPAGDYAVLITDANGCTWTGVVTVAMGTAVNELSASNILVAPTINEGSFSILSDILLTNLQVTLIDNLGKVVNRWADVNSNQTLTVDQPTKGSYFLYIAHKSGSTVTPLIIK